MASEGNWDDDFISPAKLKPIGEYDSPPPPAAARAKGKVGARRGAKAAVAPSPSSEQAGSERALV